MGFAASLALPCLAPLFFWGLSSFLRGLFCSGAFFLFFGGEGGWWPFFSFFLFLGGAFFCPFYYNKRWGGVGPSFRFPAEAKTKKQGPKNRALKKDPPEKKVPEHPPPPQNIRLPRALFWGALFWPFVWGALGPFSACFGCFLGGFFLCPFFIT